MSLIANEDKYKHTVIIYAPKYSIRQGRQAKQRCYATGCVSQCMGAGVQKLVELSSHLNQYHTMRALEIDKLYLKM